MSLSITSIASGSNGNCYYIGNDEEAVLIDAGISCKEIEQRMNRLRLSMNKVKAVFISHEHSDHIRGLTILAKKHKLPVYITTPTLQNGRLWIEQNQLRSFTHFEPVKIGGLTITSFTKFHDAADPCSFIINGNGVTIGVFTDIGIPCEQVIRYFKLCHAAFLESNYDEQMLASGSYPYILKRRISGDRGHLSNRQALELFKAHRPPFMTHLVLSHLSGNNNSPQLVAELFKQHAGSVETIVASRAEQTAVYTILPTAISMTKPEVAIIPDYIPPQLSFSF